MKKGANEQSDHFRHNRRQFLHTVGAATAGLVLSPLISPISAFARPPVNGAAVVGIMDTTETAADSYTLSAVKAKIQALFEAIGGISDIVRPSSKIALKINLVGGSGSASSSALKGVPITEAMWTHPIVMRAVAELLIDAGVSAGNITIVEALWDTAATAPFGASDSFGYLAAENATGVNLINIGAMAPYTSYATMSSGTTYHNYPSFSMNKIMQEVDVYISIPKLKHHYEAGLSASLKNQIGAVPTSLYTLPSNTSNRSALHSSDGGTSIHYLPKSVCDLNMARPVHLAIIDGIHNATGGEGVWNPTFQPAQKHVLIASKDPVAADSVGALVMGLDCEATTLPLPKGGGATCDSYLDLLNARGAGTNKRSEITLVGDGAHFITSAEQPNYGGLPSQFRLMPNFPNPFNPATNINYYLPRASQVTLRIYSTTGSEIETLVDREHSAGEHHVVWTPRNVASGTYFCRMQAGDFTETIKLLYVR
jgi:uncharacterized protein (DUF362 family)